jgi:hypothetical protein
LSTSTYSVSYHVLFQDPALRDRFNLGLEKTRADRTGQQILNQFPTRFPLVSMNKSQPGRRYDYDRMTGSGAPWPLLPLGTGIRGTGILCSARLGTLSSMSSKAGSMSSQRVQLATQHVRAAILLQPWRKP